MSPLRSQQAGRNYRLEKEREIVHNSNIKKRNLIIFRPFSPFPRTTCHHRHRHCHPCCPNNNNNNNHRRHKEQLQQHDCFKNGNEDQSDEYLKILSERINRMEKLINDLSDKVNSTSPRPPTMDTQFSNSDHLRFTPSSSAATTTTTTKAKIDFSKMNLDELIEFSNKLKKFSIKGNNNQ